MTWTYRIRTDYSSDGLIFFFSSDIIIIIIILRASNPIIFRFYIRLKKIKWRIYWSKQRLVFFQIKFINWSHSMEISWPLQYEFYLIISFVALNAHFNLVLVIYSFSIQLFLKVPNLCYFVHKSWAGGSREQQVPV